MTKIKELRAKHEKEINELQNNCNHETISEWIAECWAPGHFTGHGVKVCLECSRLVERDETGQGVQWP